VSDSTRVGAFIACYFAAAAIGSAFLPLWFADRGLTAAEIGQVLAVGSALRILTVPGWGRAADALGRRRPLLVAGALLAGVAAATLSATHGYLPILLVVLVQGTASAALTPLSDALALALAAAGRLEYGRTRAWGSVSYMLATAGGGYALAWAGTPGVPWLLAGLFAATAAAGVTLPEAEHPGRAATPDPGLLRLPAFRWTVLSSALIQGAHAAYYGFAAVHWRAAGLSDGTIGLLIAEGIIAEVALFIWGRPLVQRLGSARLTALAAAISILRWTLTAFVTSAPALALIQPLHAGTFAFQHLSSMRMLSRTVPARQAGTAQALHAALGFSVPTGVLSWVSGQVYGVAGGSVFLLMAAVGGAGLLVASRLRDIR